MNCFCILLACFLNLLTPFAAACHPTDLQSGMQGVTLSRTFISYRPFAPVIRPPNYDAAPGAAAVGAAAGMESDWAQGRQRGMTGMRLGWTEGLIVIHESVRAAAPGLGGAAGKQPTGQHRTGWKRERGRPFTADVARVRRRFRMSLTIHQIRKKCW